MAKNIEVRDFIYHAIMLRLDNIDRIDAKAIADFLSQWLEVKKELDEPTQT